MLVRVQAQPVGLVADVAPRQVVLDPVALGIAHYRADAEPEGSGPVPAARYRGAPAGIGRGNHVPQFELQRQGSGLNRPVSLCHVGVNEGLQGLLPGGHRGAQGRGGQFLPGQQVLGIALQCCRCHMLAVKPQRAAAVVIQQPVVALALGTELEHGPVRHRRRAADLCAQHFGLRIPLQRFNRAALGVGLSPLERRAADYTDDVRDIDERRGFGHGFIVSRSTDGFRRACRGRIWYPPGWRA